MVILIFNILLQYENWHNQRNTMTANELVRVFSRVDNRLGKFSISCLKVDLARIDSAAIAGATWCLELLMPEVYGFYPTDSQAYSVL